MRRGRRGGATKSPSARDMLSQSAPSRQHLHAPGTGTHRAGLPNLEAQYSAVDLREGVLVHARRSGGEVTREWKGEGGEGVAWWEALILVCGESEG